MSASPPSPDAVRDAADRLCRLAGEIGDRGWCQATSGNFSLVLERDPLKLLITPSGVHKRYLSQEHLLVVGGDGQPLSGAGARPSAETLLHTTLASRAGAGAVLHTHSVAGTLLGERFLSEGGFTLTGYEMQKGIEGIDSHERELFVPVLENSQDMTVLARQLEDLLERHRGLYGVLLAGHGLYAWGATLGEAQRHLEAFEFLFECMARKIGYAPLG